MKTHKCDALVVTCMDFRFRKFIDEWIKKNLKKKLYDLVSIAGSSKYLDFLSSQVDVSVKLHHTKNIIVIHHEDCGAYGLLSTYENHKKDLLTAKTKILKTYPKLKVKLYYLYLDGRFEEIK